MGVMKSTAAIALAVPLLIVGVPIFDTASAIVRRVLHQTARSRRPTRATSTTGCSAAASTRRQTVLIIYVWWVALAVGGYTVRWAAGPFKVVGVRRRCS